MSSDFIDYGWQDAYIQRVYSGHDRNVTKESCHINMAIFVQDAKEIL